MTCSQHRLPILQKRASLHCFEHSASLTTTVSIDVAQSAVMPRVTRAALRTQELQEESEIASSTPLPPTPTKKRVPLGEISENIATEVQAAEVEEKMAPSKKGPGRGKTANAAKKGPKQKKVKDTEAEMEVLEDENESETSSAVEEACQDLLKSSSSMFWGEYSSTSLHSQLT